MTLNNISMELFIYFLFFTILVTLQLTLGKTDSDDSYQKYTYISLANCSIELSFLRLSLFKT